MPTPSPFYTNLRKYINENPKFSPSALGKHIKDSSPDRINQMLSDESVLRKDEKTLLSKAADKDDIEMLILVLKSVGPEYALKSPSLPRQYSYNTQVHMMRGNAATANY